MPEDRKSLGAERPRSNIYAVLLVVSALAFIAALVVTIIELQDVRNFGYAFFGSETYRAPAAAAPETPGGGASTTTAPETTTTGTTTTP